MRELTVVFVIALFFMVSPLYAELRTDVLGSIDLEAKPLDMASSADGKKLYVLTRGMVNVFSVPDGKLIGTVKTDKKMDRIAGPSPEDLLLLGSSKERKVTVVSLDFIKTFDLTGSPVKGPADASVTIVVFSDFQ